MIDYDRTQVTTAELSKITRSWLKSETFLPNFCSVSSINNRFINALLFLVFTISFIQAIYSSPIRRNAFVYFLYLKSFYAAYYQSKREKRLHTVCKIHNTMNIGEFSPSSGPMKLIFSTCSNL